MSKEKQVLTLIFQGVITPDELEALSSLNGQLLEEVKDALIWRGALRVKPWMGFNIRENIQAISSDTYKQAVLKLVP